MAAILVYAYARFLKTLQLSCKITIEIRDCRLQTLIEPSDQQSTTQVRWPKTKSPSRTLSPHVSSATIKPSQTTGAGGGAGGQQPQTAKRNDSIDFGLLRKPSTVPPKLSCGGGRSRYEDMVNKVGVDESFSTTRKDVKDDPNAGLQFSWECEGLVREPSACKKVISSRQERITYKDLNKMF